MKKYSILLLTGVLTGLVGFNAEAIQTKPPTSTSWYVNAISGDTNSTLYSWMYNKGYEAGQTDLWIPGTQNSVAILDFGQPWVQGGVQGVIGFSPTFRFLNASVMKEAARQFAYGYWIGTGSDYGSQMRMVIGTNNFGSSTTYAHGQMWIQLVKDIGAQLQSYGYASQVVVYGGIDIEPGYSNSGTAISWVNGYASGFVSPYFLFNYGSADGCPLSGTTSTAGPCVTQQTIQKGYTWSQDDIQYVSYGVSPSYPLPEIYSTGGGNAKQWQQVSLYSYLAYGYAMWNIGPLSQSQACIQRGGCSGTNNTPEQAWNQFLTELNNDSRTAQDVWWSTDIKWRQ